jgi:hypothetical protein
MILGGRDLSCGAPRNDEIVYRGCLGSRGYLVAVHKRLRSALPWYFIVGGHIPRRILHLKHLGASGGDMRKDKLRNADAVFYFLFPFHVPSALLDIHRDALEESKSIIPQVEYQFFPSVQSSNSARSLVPVAPPVTA